MPDNEQPDRSHLICHRCARLLTPGAGDFYVVHIEAVADPTPPTISEQDLKGDIAAEIEHLLAQLEEHSEQELKDQVYRRLTLYLCTPCYTRWIENPTG